MTISKEEMRIIKLKRYLKMSGITHSRFADDLNVPRRHIFRYLRFDGPKRDPIKTMIESKINMYIKKHNVEV